MDPVTFGMKKNGREKETSKMIQDGCRPEFIALYTVSVMVKNGKKTLKVKDLLDDASTKTYINTDVAAELGLSGKTASGQIRKCDSQCVEWADKTI